MISKIGSFSAAVALAIAVVKAAPSPEADVDTTYPYTGPSIPIGDFVDNTIEGNGKGFVRVTEPPAVTPGYENPTNNVNVISTSFIPGGINIHYQTPFGLGTVPTIKYGTSPDQLTNTATGASTTYDRTPACSLYTDITMCSQFFHDIQISGLEHGTTYYYQIQPANGTTISDVLSFKTTQKAGDDEKFTVAVLNDFGYTNANGTYKHLVESAESGEIAFAWHGGDLSYADDWYEGFLPCDLNTSDSGYWPVCYNGSSSSFPNTDIGADVDESYYDTPLPAGEIPSQGSPRGGDISPIYESNWDLWQQWINKITTKVPYLVLPGNHEAACAEFDGPKNELTAYLVDDVMNGTAPKTELTYYSCPPSQRNFTAYQHRFRMPGDETGGVSNFWYSFDYGLAHFVSMDTETDYPDSAEWPFHDDLHGDETHPKENETYITDSGPFGYVGDYKNVKTYEQYQWLKQDLANVDRCKTPWIIAMGHRPMYSSQVSSYQKHIRNAFQDLFLTYGVDAYLSGHIHWYERLLPLTSNGSIDSGSVIDNNTYVTNPGKSLTHIINGMAGNIESHSYLDADEPILNITQVLDQTHFGFSKLTIVNSTALSWEFVKGKDGSSGDHLWLLKAPGNCSASSTSSNSTSEAPTSTTGATDIIYATTVVTETCSESSCEVYTTTLATTETISTPTGTNAVLPETSTATSTETAPAETNSGSKLSAIIAALVAIPVIPLLL